MIGFVSVSFNLQETHEEELMFLGFCVSVKRKTVPIHTEWTSRLG